MESGEPQDTETGDSLEEGIALLNPGTFEYVVPCPKCRHPNRLGAETIAVFEVPTDALMISTWPFAHLCNACNTTFAVAFIPYYQVTSDRPLYP